MIYIRKYKETDKENLRKICIETSLLPVETEEQRKYLYLMYNDYYSEAEPDNIFVAANENDEAVGYILCAENFRRYVKVFRNFYLPEIRKLGFSFWFSAISEIAGHSLFAKKYSAHLHIDILSECQGKGTGTALMNELKDHLKSKGINSIMLSCGANNTNAIKFYKKNGFKILKEMFGSCIMACEF